MAKEVRDVVGLVEVGDNPSFGRGEAERRAVCCSEGAGVGCGIHGSLNIFQTPGNRKRGTRNDVAERPVRRGFYAESGEWWRLRALSNTSLGGGNGAR